MKPLAILGLALLLLTQSTCSPAGSGAVSGDVVTIDGVDVRLSFGPSEIELEAGRYTLRFRSRNVRAASRWPGRLH